MILHKLFLQKQSWKYGGRRRRVPSTNQPYLGSVPHATPASICNGHGPYFTLRWRYVARVHDANHISSSKYMILP